MLGMLGMLWLLWGSKEGMLEMSPKRRALKTVGCCLRCGRSVTGSSSLGLSFEAMNSHWGKEPMIFQTSLINLE
ncbi:uncharacterized protein F4822DRAFT_305038 [Hypoxylon trugodes]|uniref:uncharacterized protein n=1 Tax=Hypoxylon trugodes TaxID=326681 RepID=UPI00219305ED|nr:uncharacterized protein F4822DRAFT_305038 [Hypoxylon trugodes]KAI1386084.1 hypothetical protein F4822DRAFT_305038 [Hypoxylon trugodes]